jgi:iron(III) transport system permease protein
MNTRFDRASLGLGLRGTAARRALSHYSRFWTQVFEHRTLVIFGSLVLALVAFMAAYPVVLLFIKSFTIARPGEPAVWGLGNWIATFGDFSLIDAFGYTFALALARTVISIVIAIFFVWAVTRTDMPYRGFIETTLWLGFFLPVLPMTLGWMLLLDPSVGVLNKFLADAFGWSEAPFNVYSFWGIVWCHLAYSVSIRFLLLAPAFRSMDASLDEAARMSGSGTFGALLRINVPILAPAIIASISLGFIKSLESFEIEWLLGRSAGISVVSTKIYDLISYQPPFYGRATSLCAIFLFFIFVMIWMQKIFLRKRDYTTLSGRGFTTRPIELGRYRWLVFAVCVSFLAIFILLPLAMLLMGTFMNVFGFFNLEKTWTVDHWVQAFDDPLFLSSLKNTLITAGGATLGGAMLYAVVSYIIVRTSYRGRHFIDFLSWFPWALPGVLISLALLWVVLGTGGALRLIYGTTLVVALAIIVKEMPLGVQMMKTGTVQISRELEEASRMSGASWRMTFRQIMLPLLQPSIIAVGIVLFIVSFREISAVIFLASHDSRTLSLLMMDYISDSMIESATVLGVFIVVLLLVFLGIGSLFGLRPSRT